VKNELEARADPRPDPPPKRSSLIIKNPSGTEGNTPVEVLGRFLSWLWALRIGRKVFRPFFFFHLVPQLEQRPPPALHRRLSTSAPVGNSIVRGNPETRDSSRELASNQVHLPSQSQISHDLKYPPGKVDQRSNREILLSVEWSLNSKEFAGSRESTGTSTERGLVSPLIDFQYKEFREEVREIRLLLAEIPNEKFSFETFRLILQVVDENPTLFQDLLARGVRTEVWPIPLLIEGFSTDPEPGELFDSNPNPIQGDLPDRSPDSPSGGNL